MKIEVGKFYRTRRGEKVGIYAVDGNGLYFVHDDIVSEWEEPPAKKSRMLAYRTAPGIVLLKPDDSKILPDLDWVRVPHLDEPL